MDQQNHSIIAPSMKDCPRDNCQMKIAKAGSTFVWRCTCCDYTDPLTDVHTERHTFSFNQSLQELRIAWPGCPHMTRFLDIEECYHLQELLNRELPACCRLHSMEVSRP